MYQYIYIYVVFLKTKYYIQNKAYSLNHNLIKYYIRDMHGHEIWVGMYGDIDGWISRGMNI